MTTQLRLLIATGLYPPESGGPATYSKLLHDELPKRGIEVRVLPFSDVRHLPPVIRHAAYLLNVLAAGRLADLIYAQDTMSVGVPALCAALIAGKRFVVRVPGDYAWEQGCQRFGVGDTIEEFQTKKYGWRVELMRTLERAVVRRAQAVVVPSEYMRRIVVLWGASPARVTVIYSSIEVPQPAPIDRPEGFLVVSSGRRVPWKGFEALARVVRREPAWHFFLAQHLPRAEALGWVKAADVYVLNSTYEGLSHALVEAMALGTPVVATAVGGNPELIGDGVDGLLIPPKDDESLYAALKEVEHNPEAARERAARAMARARDFSIDKTIGQLIDLLQTV